MIAVLDRNNNINFEKSDYEVWFGTCDVILLSKHNVWKKKLLIHN